MPGPQYLVLASSPSQVTSAFYIDKPCNLVVFEVPSFGTGAAVFAEFTQLSGSAPFSPPWRLDGSGVQHVVFSGTAGGWGYVVPPTHFGRLRVTSAQTAVMTFTLLPR